jgi:hypothetical protein
MDYWSSTTELRWTFTAWAVSFDDGSVSRSMKENLYMLRAVRQAR